MRSIKLLTWNVHKCKGRDGERNPDRILQIIAAIAPDVAVLQEVDRKFGTDRGLLDPEKVKSITGMNLPFANLAKGAKGYRGNAILIKDDILCHSVKNLPLPSLEPRGAALWSLEADGVVFEVIGMHLGLLETWRHLQIASIASEIAGRTSVPTVVAGDSNDWRRKSKAMHPLERILDTDSLRLKTFPARKPMLSLDRILAGRGAVIERIETTDGGIASDHLPLASWIALGSSTGLKTALAS